MLSNKRRLELLEGDTKGGRLPLINSIRRGLWLKNREQREREKFGGDRDKYFPDEYGKSLADDRVVPPTSDLKDLNQAGVVNLQVMKDKDNKDPRPRKLNIANQIVDIGTGGRLRILDKDVIDGMLGEGAERRRYIDALLGVILEGGTELGDSIARYILNEDEFKVLLKNGADPENVLGMAGSELAPESGLPSIFLTYPPSSTKFQKGLQKLRLVLQKSSSFFDSDLSEWKKKYGGEVRDLVRAEAF